MASNASDEHAPAQPAQPDPWAADGDPWVPPQPAERAERQAQTVSQGSAESWSLADNAGPQPATADEAGAQAAAPTGAAATETEGTAERTAVTGGAATQVAAPAYGRNVWWPREQGQAWEQDHARNPWNSYRGPTDNYAGYDDPADRPWDREYRPPEWQTAWQPPPRATREEDCFDKDKDPCPRWEGDHPESSLKPWLREIKRWYNHTIVAPKRRGQKLLRALPTNSMAYRASLGRGY